MKISKLIRIRRARKKDAQLEISLKGYFETLERFRIRAENVTNMFEVGQLIDDSCSFTEKAIAHGRKVLKALESVCQNRIGTDNPSSALQLLNFEREYRDYLQKEIEGYQVMQDIKEDYGRVQNAS